MPTEQEAWFLMDDECGRWDNGRLRLQCRLAGTEFCDFDCPYRDGGE